MSSKVKFHIIPAISCLTKVVALSGVLVMLWLSAPYD